MKLKGLFNSNKKKKILLLDDSKVFAFGMKSLIDQNLNDQYSLEIILDSPSLFRKLKNEIVDFLIMDFFLDDDSDLEGVELLKSLKNIYPNLKVVMLTSNNDYQIAKQCYEIGVDLYLIKDANSPKQTALKISDWLLIQ